jgi:hypothetical protein
MIEEFDEDLGDCLDDEGLMKKEKYVEAKMSFFASLETKEEDCEYSPLFYELLRKYPPKNYNRD